MRLFLTILTILMCLHANKSTAQYKQMTKQGNKLYEQKKYKEATDAYMRALQKNPTYTPSAFNLGNALYQQKQYDGTRKVMEQVAKMDTTRAGKSAANYNTGNTYMAEQKWEEAIEAYKQALRQNPQDADAKYNLSYAQQMLKKNGGSGKNNKNDKDNKDDKNKDKQKDQQNKDENKKDDKQKDQQQNNDNKEDKKEEQDKRPQPQQSKLSEKQAEQLLNALQQEEKKLQDKHKKAKGVPVKVEKDW